jgi:hypothetical protein
LFNQIPGGTTGRAPRAVGAACVRLCAQVGCTVLVPAKILNNKIHSMSGTVKTHDHRGLIMQAQLRSA